MLDVQEVHAFYGDSHVLQGVSIQIPEAARVAIVGRNGAGKSTLLKSIMNAGPMTSGRIVFDGKVLGSMPCFRRARLGIAFVPEDRRIFTHITASENLRMAGQAVRPGHPRVDPREVLARFPLLVPLEHRPGGNMSGGQQQILAIARAIAARPRLMLLDEPTEGLAPVIVEQLAADVVATCRQLNAGLLLCEQNLWFAEQCTDYVYVLDSGRIVWQGDWTQFSEHEAVLQRHLAL